MVADNVERLKRIVDDVMEVAPGAAAGDACHRRRRRGGAGSGRLGAHGALPWAAAAVCMWTAEPAAGVLFDPEHLRRVLVNLLDNAHRHASALPGAIAPAADGGDEASLVTLSVCQRWRAHPPEVERHLFEPFFSTRSRGTGLGLYICRELCERYGASIDLPPPPGPRGCATSSAW
jgi:two-component system sensor histidine kinase PilS (NtrC family)